jgi:arsenate reductase (thioredoxin)
MSLPPTSIKDRPRILFVCVENAGRSQMAEAFARHLSQEAVEAWSAGSKPASAIHPEVVSVMKEFGMDLSAKKPKGFDALPQVAWDVIVTMGCEGRCPLALALRREDWNLPDPQGQSLDAVRHLRDQIQQRVQKLLHRFALP